MSLLFIERSVLPVTLFISSNLDNLLVLMVLFCTPVFPVKAIVVSQFASQFLLILASLVLANLAFIVPPAYIGLLGLLPLTIGVIKLIERSESRLRVESIENAENRGVSSSTTMSIMLLMLSTGGDNLSVYVPVFTRYPMPVVIAYSGVFLAMAGIWCAIAYTFATHPAVGRTVRRYSERFLPWNMIGLGAYLLSGPLRGLLRQ